MAGEPHAMGMVGRDHLRARLLDVLGAAAGPGRLLWVEGEAGIGKTRLLAEADAIARDFGLGVLRGIGWSDPATPAYWVWTQVLRQALPAGGATNGAEVVRVRWGERGRADGTYLTPTQTIRTKTATKTRSGSRGTSQSTTPGTASTRRAR